MKKKATIYPYSKEDVQFFRYASLLCNIDPVHAVSPSGWGLCGYDVTEIDGGKASGIKITDDLVFALKNSEFLILTSFAEYYGDEGGLKNTLENTVKNKIPFMLCFAPDKSEDQEAISNILAEAKQLGLLNMPEHENNPRFAGLDYCMVLNSPVSLIVGHGPSTAKFETQLGLRKELFNRGFKISQIGSRPYCELFGFHSFPSFMLNDRLSETEKVISFNHFIKRIEEIEKPDLIIIGIPGGIMPIVNKVHNNYGILHVEVASALEPDNIIYNLYSNYYTSEYYNRSVEFIFNRLNKTMPACFIVTNQWVDYGKLDEQDIFNVVTFNKMYDEIVEKPGKGIPVISILEPGVFPKVADAALSLLEKYGSVETF
jgi:peptide maturation system protein (TIGR04066 family)